jgi:hypothetical protein
VTRQTAAINAGRGHDRPERARACFLTGEVAAAPGAGYAKYRSRLDETSRRVIESADRPDAPSADSGPAGSPDTADARETAGHARWLALCRAPDDRADITGLMRMTGRTRTRLTGTGGSTPAPAARSGSAGDTAARAGPRDGPCE